jgi:hypothetical protein
MLEVFVEAGPRTIGPQVLLRPGDLGYCSVGVGEDENAKMRAAGTGGATSSSL